MAKVLSVLGWLLSMATYGLVLLFTREKGTSDR
jgi:hypothetical protein